MTEMFKDLRFYGIVLGYIIGLSAIIAGIRKYFDVNIFASAIIGFVLSGLILIGVSLMLIKEDNNQNKPTEYNFNESKELLEE